MTSFDDAVGAVKGVLGDKEDRISWQIGYLGNGTGTNAAVRTARKNFYWVRYPYENSPAVPVYSVANVPLVPGIRVKVGYLPWEPGVFQIISQSDQRLNDNDTTTGDETENPAEPGPYAGAPPHAVNHTYLNVDPVYINWRQITPLGVYPTSPASLSIQVYSGYIPRPGTDVFVTAQTVDLTASVPGSGARYVLISFDTTGAVVTTVGTVNTGGFGALTAADIPITPSGNWRSAAVILYAGQTAIVENRDEIDIYDLRFPEEASAGFSSYLDDVVTVGDAGCSFVTITQALAGVTSSTMALVTPGTYSEAANHSSAIALYLTSLQPSDQAVMTYNSGATLTLSAGKATISNFNINSTAGGTSGVSITSTTADTEIVLSHCGLYCPAATYAISAASADCYFIVVDNCFITGNVAVREGTYLRDNIILGDLTLTAAGANAYVDPGLSTPIVELRGGEVIGDVTVGVGVTLYLKNIPNISGTVTNNGTIIGVYQDSSGALHDVAAGPHNILSATHSDTLADTVVAGDVIIGNATPKWSRLAAGAQYKTLTMGATLPAWSSYLIDGTAGGKTVLDVTNAKTLTLTATDTYTLTIPKTGTLTVGTGTAGRIAEWVTDANTLQASTLIKTGVGVLTLSVANTQSWTIPANAAGVLTNDGAGGLSWEAAGGAHTILSATHTDTLVDTVVAGDIIIGNATPKWSRLAAGAQYTILTMGGASLPGWSSYLLAGTLGGKTVLDVADTKVLTLMATDTYTLEITGTASISGTNTGDQVPGGTNTHVQFNDSGAFGGESGLTWDKTNNTLTLNAPAGGGTYHTGIIQGTADGGDNYGITIFGGVGGGGGDIDGGIVDMIGGGGINGGNGGMMSILGGPGGPTGNGGDIDFIGGLGGATSGNGGLIKFIAGSADGGGSGGNIEFKPGAGVGTANGKIVFAAAVGAGTAYLDLDSLTFLRTFTFPDASGTFMLTADSANPTASVGLTAVNGAAATFMRSDAAPALNVSIVPTWSGIHTFSNTTDSSSVSTGAIVTSGGVGVAKAVSIGTVLGVGVAPASTIGVKTQNAATAFSGWCVDSGTNNVLTGMQLIHNSDGAIAAGFGIQMNMYLQSTTTANRLVSQDYTSWVVATDASRTARRIWLIYDTAAREGLRIEASGTAPMIGFLGAGAVARQVVGAAAPAGGTGATAGAYDTAAHRDSAITLLNNIRTALINLGLCSA